MCWLRIWPQGVGLLGSPGPEKDPEKKTPLPWGLSEVLQVTAGPIVGLELVEIRCLLVYRLILILTLKLQCCFCFGCQSLLHVPRRAQQFLGLPSLLPSLSAASVFSWERERNERGWSGGGRGQSFKSCS